MATTGDCVDLYGVQQRLKWDVPSMFTLTHLVVRQDASQRTRLVPCHKIRLVLKLLEYPRGLLVVQTIANQQSLCMAPYERPRIYPANNKHPHSMPHLHRNELGTERHDVELGVNRYVLLVHLWNKFALYSPSFILEYPNSIMCGCLSWIIPTSHNELPINRADRYTDYLATQITSCPSYRHKINKFLCTNMELSTFA